MEVKSTLKVVNISKINGAEGVIPEQSMRRLIGCPEIPTDRLRVGHATYTPGSKEALHWHPIEAFYYILSGHATVRDIEGKEYEVSAGSFLYCPPGIAGAALSSGASETAASVVMRMTMIWVDLLQWK